MSESNPESQKPLKRSEVLAIENVKRIADQLRSERNDAVALAQVMRERADGAVGLLNESIKSLGNGPEHAELLQRIEDFLKKIGDQ